MWYERYSVSNPQKLSTICSTPCYDVNIKISKLYITVPFQDKSTRDQWILPSTRTSIAETITMSWCHRVNEQFPLLNCHPILILGTTQQFISKAVCPIDNTANIYTIQFKCSSVSLVHEFVGLIAWIRTIFFKLKVWSFSPLILNAWMWNVQCILVMNINWYTSCRVQFCEAYSSTKETLFHTHNLRWQLRITNTFSRVEQQIKYEWNCSFISYIVNAYLYFINRLWNEPVEHGEITFVNSFTHEHRSDI